MLWPKSPPPGSATPAVARTWPSSSPSDRDTGEGAPPPWPTSGNGSSEVRLKAAPPPLQPERPEGEEGPGAGFPAKTLAWLLPAVAAALVLSSIGAALGDALTGSSKSALTDLLGEAGLWAAMFGTASVVSHRYGTGHLRQDFGLAWTRKDVLWAALAAVSALVVSEFVVEAFAGTRFSGSNTQIITQQQGHEVGLVLVSLLVAVGAPFFEELFFRGYLRIALQQALKQLFGDSRRGLSAHGAVWLQAAFFGFAHFGEASKLAGNVSVVLAMFGVGVVLGYTARFTGRLGAGMLAHGTFNLLALISVL